MTEVTATIKWPGKDQPWLVAKGTVDEAKSQLGSAFGFDIEGLTLAEVIQTAQGQVGAMGRVGTVLGGNPLPRNEGGAWDAVNSGQTAAAAEPAVNPLVAGLAECTTQDEVKTYWAKNRAAFDAEPAMTEAMKARYKELA